MKKLLLIFMIFLVGCTKEITDTRVIVDTETFEGQKVNERIMVPIEAVEALDVDILRNGNTVYLTNENIQTEVSNNRPYVWYIDQGDTGKYAGDNCGPSSTVMAALWQNHNFDETPVDARSEFRSAGGWWYTEDIEDYFDRYKIRYDIDDFDDAYEWIAELSSGNILLLCLDTTYLSFQDNPDDYVGRFYSYTGGHFLILKGYKYIMNELYFEVYDSNNWGSVYSDGSPKGKDRLYPADELMNAVDSWWSNYFIIYE
ncbi:MAG: hypothetical protein JXR88_08260 [Clostridia bacterium]|nr:hypothetical protein [Clostridia bacterium]